MNIEVEIKALLTKEQYEQLLELFKKEGEFLQEDYQETYYFKGEQDLRIQKNNYFSKIVLKQGKVHDEMREEREITCSKEQFEELEKLFLSLGYEVEIKWFRNRNSFTWKGISVEVDFTKGYGYILEMEKMADEATKEEALSELKQRLQELRIPLTPRDEFDTKFDHYRKNWQHLV